MNAKSQIELINGSHYCDYIIEKYGLILETDNDNFKLYGTNNQIYEFDDFYHMKYFLEGYEEAKHYDTAN